MTRCRGQAATSSMPPFRNWQGKAEPTDVFVLYLAGHGKTVDGRYYFMPQDFQARRRTQRERRHRCSGEDQGHRAGAVAALVRIDSARARASSCSIPATRHADRRCRSDAARSNRARPTTGWRRPPAVPSSRPPAAARRRSEGYRGHGLFTYEAAGRDQPGRRRQQRHGGDQRACGLCLRAGDRAVSKKCSSSRRRRRCGSPPIIRWPSRRACWQDEGTPVAMAETELPVGAGGRAADRALQAAPRWSEACRRRPPSRCLKAGTAGR